MKYLLVLIILVCSSGQLFSQDYTQADYEVWPEYVVNFEHLDLELEWDGFDELSGTAVYRIRPYFDEPDSIVLHAPNHNIKSVRIDEEVIQITHENGLLTIHTDQKTLVSTQSYLLAIEYETRHRFGVFHGSDDILRTSLLPKSVRHWLPSFDHPQTRLTTNLKFAVPSGYSVAANGAKSETVKQNGMDVWRFESDQDISISELVWSAGYFNIEEEMFGNKRVRLYSDEHLDGFSNSEILEESIQKIRDAERLLNLEFPGRELNLVIVGDDFWETKNAAGNVGYIYLDRGNISQQLSKIILYQWFGSYWQMEQWSDMEALSLIQYLVAQELKFDWTISELYPYPDLQITNHIYQPFDTYRNATWDSIDDEKLLEVAGTTFPEFIQLSSGISSWRNIAALWYKESGKAWKEPVTPQIISRPDTLQIAVKFTVDAINNRIVVEVESGREFDFEIKVLTNDELKSYTISVSGDGDRIPVSVSGRVQAIIPGETNHAAVELIEEKSLTLWLNQLRADELSESQRIEAAKAISKFSDDPDLQLLLRDVLNRVEGEEEITAEIYRTLGNITAGASGVERLFLQGLASDSELIRNASLESLRFYSGNEEITEAVFNVISGSDDIEFVNLAIPVYGNLIEEDEYQSFIGQFLNEDVELEFTHTLLDELFMLSDKEFVVERGEAYLSNRYPFSLRYKAFHHLLDYDDSRTRWKERQTNLANDSDPRMRYLILNLAADDGNRNILQERLDAEPDQRVRQLIESKL